LSRAGKKKINPPLKILLTPLSKRETSKRGIIIK